MVASTSWISRSFWFIKKSIRSVFYVLKRKRKEIPCKAASKDPFQRLCGILVLYDKISHLQSVYDHRGRKYWFSCPRSKIGRLHDQTIEVNWVFHDVYTRAKNWFPSVVGRGETSFIFDFFYGKYRTWRELVRYGWGCISSIWQSFSIFRIVHAKIVLWLFSGRRLSSHWFCWSYLVCPDWFRCCWCRCESKKRENWVEEYPSSNCIVQP